MSVRVESLTKVYGEQTAVNAISFEVEKGEVVGFLGPNGAGKSTTMKILSGYIPQTSGTASVEGFDVVSQSMQVRKHTGYLPENNPLYTDMYVHEYLGWVARMYGLGKSSKARIAEMIETTGLTLESKKKIGQLSKGYRQRVGLAQALLHDPDVLILDEPTAGLDPNQLAEIRELIKNLGRDKTVILSTHIMQEVQAICDRVLIIHQGNLVANDTTENLQQQLEGMVPIELELDQAVEPAQLKQIKGVDQVETIGKAHYRLTAEGDIRKELFDWAVAQNRTILTLKRDKRNLEEVFRSLTAQRIAEPPKAEETT